MYYSRMKNYIKQLREDRKLTTAQLGELAGTTQQQISLLENSKRSLRWDWIVRLADALQCHPMDITEGPGGSDPLERELIAKFRRFHETDKLKYVSIADAFIGDRKNGKDDKK